MKKSDKETEQKEFIPGWRNVEYGNGVWIIPEKQFQTVCDLLGIPMPFAGKEKSLETITEDCDD
jgi:hypothetical protein